MIYDDLSFFILRNILEKKETTTWDMAKKYFADEISGKRNSKQKERFLIKKTNLIKSRLNKMSKEGIVLVSKNSWKNQYVLLVENVKFLKRHKFFDRYSKAIMIKEKDGNCCIFEI